MTRLEELKQRYINEPPKLSKQLCLLESEIRKELAQLKIKHADVLKWFNENLGVTAGIHEYRVSLTEAIAGGSTWADPVFDRIDNHGMSYTMAAKLVRRASKRAKTSGELTVAQALKLEMDELREKRLIIPHTSKSENPVKRAASRGNASKGLISGIELLVEEYIETTSAGIEPYLVSKYKGDFLATIKIAYQEFTFAMSRARQSHKLTTIEKVGKKRFSQACQVLGLSKAVFGKPINLLDVKRRKNKRAVELHPDKHQGLPASQLEKIEQEFNVVMDAYRVLETYAETLGV